jgi:hypothetical protein
VAKDFFAVAGNVFGEPKGIVGVAAGRGKERGEEVFAFAEGEVAGVVAVEVEEVEDEVGEGMGFSVLKGGLEEGEAGGAVGGEDDDFAVEGAVVGGEVGDGLGDVGHAVGPVDTFASEELDFLSGLAGLDTVAIELEFVDPVVCVGDGGGFESQLRGDEVGLPLVGKLVEVDGGRRGLFGGCGLFGGDLCGGLGCDAGGGFEGICAVGVPDVVGGVGDLVDGAAGDGGVGALVGDLLVAGAALVLVVLLDEEPLGLVFGAVGRVVHADEGPLALHLGAIHFELEVAGAEAGIDVFAAKLGPPAALVPDHDGAAAVLAFGDDALESTVFEGMIFDFYGEAALGRVIAGALGAGPGFEDAIPAEAEVVVEVGGCVLLDDEREAARGGRLAHGEGVGVGAAAGGLGGGVEVAHGAIALELRIDGRGRGGGMGVALADGGFLCGGFGSHDGFLCGLSLGRGSSRLGGGLGGGLDEGRSFARRGLGGGGGGLCGCAFGLWGSCITYGLTQGVHEVNDLALGAGRGLLAGDGGVFELGVDELFDGGLVAIGELGGIEGGGLALDEFLGE